MSKKKMAQLSGRGPLSASFKTFLLAAVITGPFTVALAVLLWVQQDSREPAVNSGATPTIDLSGAPVEKPYLGITYVPVTAHMATYYGLATSSGVIITAVAQGSPAQKAGLQVDDIVTEFDGLVLSNDVTIIDILNQRAVGQNVEVSVVRNGERRKVGVVLGPRPGS